MNRSVILLGDDFDKLDQDSRARVLEVLVKHFPGFNFQSRSLDLCEILCGLAETAAVEAAKKLPEPARSIAIAAAKLAGAECRKECNL